MAKKGTLKRNAPSGTKPHVAKSPKLEPIQSLDESRLNFMNLPPEIRNIIYEHDLLEDRIIRIRAQAREFHGRTFLNVKEEHAHPWREPAILRVSKLTRKEAGTMYYGSHDFDLSMKIAEMPLAVSWIRTVVKTCGNRPFRHFNFFIHNQRWKNILHLRPLVHLFAEFKIQLVHRPVPQGELLVNRSSLYDVRSRPDSLFYLAGPYGRDMQDRLGEAVKLGQKAQTAGWKEDRVDIECRLWYENITARGTAAVYTI